MMKKIKVTTLFLVSLAILGLNVNSVLAADIVFSQEVVRQPDLSNIEFAVPTAAVSQPATTSDATVITDSQIPVNPELTSVTPSVIEPGEPLILLNTQTFDLKKAEVWAGKKFKVFDSKFVFQIDKETLKADATLVLKEFMLAPASTMQPKLGCSDGQ